MKKRYTLSLGVLLIIVAILNAITLYGKDKVSMYVMVEIVCFFISGALFLLSYMLDNKNKNKNKKKNKKKYKLSSLFKIRK